MAFKDILIFLDPTPASDARLQMAIRLAKDHGARLIGVDATASSAFEKGPWRERALQVGRNFEELTQSAGVEARLVGTDYHEGGLGPDLSHCVDLVIAPRPEGEARELVAPFVPDEVLMNSGEPTLIVPQEWTFGPLGESVVIAWNASREATRAVHDALPILEKARKVVVFAFSHKASGLRASAEALTEHLARHGVKAIVSDWTNTGEISAVEALFASLDTQDCDLIVAGGFGHSRTFEGLFGGVSLDLLKQPALPVLMSH
jgi:nucleotide-binding universal stress UspA family protein